MCFSIINSKSDMSSFLPHPLAELLVAWADPSMAQAPVCLEPEAAAMDFHGHQAE